MMLTRIPALLSLAALLIGANASAASLSLVSNPILLTVGSPVVITVQGSGFTALTNGGDFSLSFSSTALQFVSASVAGTQFDTSFFDTTNAGSGLVTGDVFRSAAGAVGPGPFAVAHFSFNVLAGLGAGTTLQLGPGPLSLGWWDPMVEDQYVISHYGSLQVGPAAVVPVPAAVWLFGSALGLMGVMRRKLAS